MKVTPTLTIRGVNAVAFGSRALEIGLSGPSGCGKTAALLAKINALARMYPDLRLALLRKTRKSMNTSILETWEADPYIEIYPRKYLAKHPIERGSRSYYRYPNGSEVHVFGMDNADKFLGSRWDYVYVNEVTEFSESEFGQIKSRLQRHKGPFNQIMYDCNPPKNGKQHWLWRRHERGNTILLFSDHSLNPNFTDKALLDSLPADLKARFSDGSWDGIPEGGLWKPHWFNYLKAMPQQGKWIIGVDTASSESPDSDETAMALIGFCKIEERPAIVNAFMKFGHWNPGERNAQMRLFYKRFEHLKPKLYFGKGFGQGKDMNLSIMDALHGIPAYGFPEKGTKVQRADPLIAQTYAGNYYLVKDDDLPESDKWNVPYVIECCDFTGEEGKMDNKVDACSVAYIMLARTYPEIGKMLASAGLMTEEEILKYRKAA